MQELLKCNKNLHNVLIPFPISEAVKNYIEEEKESKDLSQDDFEKRYSAEMDMCKVLGKNGWVVSGHSNPRIIKEWYDDIQSGNVKEIEDFFTENENHVLKTIIDDLKKNDCVVWMGQCIYDDVFILLRASKWFDSICSRIG